MLNSNNPYINQAYNKMTGSPSTNRQWRTPTGSNIPFEDPGNFGDSGNPRIRSNNDIFGKTKKLMSSRLDDELYDYQMNSNRSNADLARNAQEEALQNIMQKNASQKSLESQGFESVFGEGIAKRKADQEEWEKRKERDFLRSQEIELTPQQKLQQRKDRIALQAYELSQVRPNLEHQKQIDELTKQSQLNRLSDELK